MIHQKMDKLDEKIEKITDELEYVKSEIARVEPILKDLTPAELDEIHNENHARIEEIDEQLPDAEFEEEQDLQVERDQLLNGTREGLISLGEREAELQEDLDKNKAELAKLEAQLPTD